MPSTAFAAAKSSRITGGDAGKPNIMSSKSTKIVCVAPLPPPYCLPKVRGTRRVPATGLRQSEIELWTETQLLRRCFAIGIVLFCNLSLRLLADEAPVQRRLYVASPGIRNYLRVRGSRDFGLRHRRRPPVLCGGFPWEDWARMANRLNIKGICGNAQTGRVYVSTLAHLICIDLTTDESLWQRSYEGGCDRMSISPDGTHIYLPTLEQDHWKVVDAADGHELARVTPDSGAHNTVYGLNGREAYLAGPAFPAADRRRHARSFHRSHRRPVQQQHPPVHCQWRTNPVLRQRQRTAGLRNRRPTDRPNAAPRRSDQASPAGPSNAMAAPVTGLA